MCNIFRQNIGQMIDWILVDCLQAYAPNQELCVGPDIIDSFWKVMMSRNMEALIIVVISKRS